VDNTLLDLQNSSYLTQPHSRIAKCRPLLLVDEENTTSDFSKDNHAKLKKEMANATNTSANPTDMFDHDPTFGGIQ